MKSNLIMAALLAASFTLTAVAHEDRDDRDTCEHRRERRERAEARRHRKSEDDCIERRERRECEETPVFIYSEPPTYGCPCYLPPPAPWCSTGQYVPIPIPRRPAYIQRGLR